MSLARARPENGSPNRPVHTILLVEDDVLIRATLGEFLRDGDYRVLEAVNATEARAVLDSGTPVDLVFSDVRMPGGENGVGLALWIRQRHPDVAVLLASGFADNTDARALPADIPVLRKPYVLTTVLQQIRLLLREAGAGTP